MVASPAMTKVCTATGTAHVTPGSASGEAR